MQRWSRCLLVSMVVLGIVGPTSEASGGSKWGPFRGQVVDLETGGPIPGAVALVVWWQELPNLIHASRRVYDTKEAITGPDGHFEVPRLSVPLWSLGLQPGAVTIFAPGYQWTATLVTPPTGEQFVDPTVIQMRRLKTPEDERKYLRRLLPAGVPHEKMRQFIRALNEQRAALGMGTYSTGEEE